MSTRSLNKVILIGNLTRDPELRFTPAGTGVCTFGLATNRSWTTQTGETKEETEFHKIVAWNKLGELCSQLLTKGRKVYVEGRLSTHSWIGQDGAQRTSTEVVIDDMIILDSKKAVLPGEVNPAPIAQVSGVKAEPTVPVRDISEVSQNVEDKKMKIKEDKKEDVGDKSVKGSVKQVKTAVSEDITPDDIPF